MSTIYRYVIQDVDGQEIEIATVYDSKAEGMERARKLRSEGIYCALIGYEFEYSNSFLADDDFDDDFDVWPDKEAP